MKVRRWNNMAGISKEAMERITEELEGRQAISYIAYVPDDPSSPDPSGATLHIANPFGIEVKRYDKKGNLIYDDIDVGY
jgi:hypothetical protein